MSQPERDVDFDLRFDMTAWGYDPDPIVAVARELEGTEAIPMSRCMRLGIRHFVLYRGDCFAETPDGWTRVQVDS